MRPINGGIGFWARFVAACLVLAAALVPAACGAQGASPEVLREIQELRQRIGELEKLKERLDALERQVRGAAPPAPPTAAPSKAPTPVPQAPAKPGTGRTVSVPLRITGFLQARYEWNEARRPRSDFWLRRARLRLQAEPTPWAAAVLYLESAGSGVEALDAYADVKSRQGAFLRGGQFKPPFGIEVPEYPADRLAPEASRAISVLFGPTLRDRGFMVGREPRAGGNGLSAYLGVFNGNGSGRRDNNGTKDLGLRVARTFEWGSLGASGYTGRFTRAVTAGGATTNVTTAKDRYGLDLLARVGRAELRSEVIAGKDLGASVRGGYLQAAYRLSRPTGYPFVKLDWYDPNRHAGGDYYSRWTLGYAHQLGPNTRVTLAEQLAHDSATPTGDNATTFQVQVRY